MTAPTPKQTWPRLLGEIVFLAAMFTGILLGVPKMLTLFIPADYCAGTPVRQTAFFMVLVVWAVIGFPKGKDGFLPLLRLGAVMMGGTLTAVLAARLAAGCTPVDDWSESARFMIETVVILTITTLLAHLHREVIEPRWSRAMGEGGEPAQDEEDAP